MTLRIPDLKMILRKHSLVLCLLAINIVSLYPLLTTGFLGDDILNSQIRGEMVQMHRTLWSVTVLHARLWIKNEGRLIPLAFYIYAAFYVFKSILVFKLFVLTIVIAGVLTFFVFLKNLTGSELIPAACLLLLPLIVQFRRTWDPILGFCAQYPLLAFLLFSSLILFLKFLDAGDRRALAIAIILFLCCELIFETSYPMSLLYIVVAFSRLRKPRAAIIASWPFLAVTAVLTSISAVLKRHAAVASQAYAPNFDSARVIKAYAVQSLGAVPFSYYWLDPYDVFSSQVSGWPAPIVQQLPLLVALAVVAVLLTRNRFSGDPTGALSTRTVDLLAIGILLFALPQGLISLSPKYQEMIWGTAYLPVYISRFGLSVLLALLLVQFYRVARVTTGRKRVLLGVGLVSWILLFGLNLQHNYLVAITENEDYWYSRSLTEEALARGLLANVPAGSVLLVNGTSLWDSPNEYSSKTHRPYLVYQLNATEDLTRVFRSLGGACKPVVGQWQCEFLPESPVYTVQIRHVAEGKGAVFLAHVSRLFQVDNRIRGMLSDQIIAYFSLPRAFPEPAVSISGRDLRPKEASASLFRTDEGDLTVLASGRAWTLVSLRLRGMFDALSLQGDIWPAVSSSTVLIAKNGDALELHSRGSELIHLGFEGAEFGNGVTLPPITFNDDMSIDLLVTPGQRQVPYAEILSNHATDFRGIAIEQRGSAINEYSVVFGNGKEWMHAGDFSLPPGRRSYISLQVKNKETSLYINGELVAHKVMAVSIPSTNRPLRIGNWIGRDRQFNGLIDEVLIANGTRTGPEVRAIATSLRKNGNAPPAGD